MSAWMDIGNKLIENNPDKLKNCSALEVASVLEGKTRTLRALAENGYDPANADKHSHNEEKSVKILPEELTLYKMITGKDQDVSDEQRDKALGLVVQEIENFRNRAQEGKTEHLESQPCGDIHWKKGNTQTNNTDNFGVIPQTYEEAKGKLENRFNSESQKPKEEINVKTPVSKRFGGKTERE